VSRFPTLEHWRRGHFFGVPVVTGYIDGRRITARCLWMSHGRFGITRGEAGGGTEEILVVGEPDGPDPFGIQEEPP
jgi:hypothetical protein